MEEVDKSFEECLDRGEGGYIVKKKKKKYIEPSEKKVEIKSLAALDS